jgi:hypothetical protein
MQAAKATETDCTPGQGRKVAPVMPVVHNQYRAALIAQARDDGVRGSGYDQVSCSVDTETVFLQNIANAIGNAFIRQEWWKHWPSVPDQLACSPTARWSRALVLDRGVDVLGCERRILTENGSSIVSRLVEVPNRCCRNACP